MSITDADVNQFTCNRKLYRATKVSGKAIDKVGDLDASTTKGACLVRNHVNFPNELVKI